MTLRSLDPDGELDTFDLIQDLEESFGITIDQHDAGRLVTVGHLEDLVCGRVPGNRTSHCMTAAAFYRVRRALIEEFDVSRRDVRPAARMCTLIPRPSAAAWRRCATSLGAELPPLRRSRQAVGAILLACFTAFMSVLAVGYASPIGVFASILMAALAAAMVAFLASMLTSALATRVPFETAGAFARWFVSRHYALLAEHAGVNERETRDAVRDLVAYHYGTRPEDVGAETRFV